MTQKEPIRVAIIGTGKRSDYLYGPILAALPGEVELVSVWGRSSDSARRLSESLGAPSYTGLDRLVRETAPQIGIVSTGLRSVSESIGLCPSRPRALCYSAPRIPTHHCRLDFG